MSYLEIKFVCSPNNDIVNSILSSVIAEIGFESFEETESGTTGYIEEKIFDEKALQRVIDNFPVEADISYSVKKTEDRNWNEEWEKNYFQPLVIDNRCIIYSTFHDVRDTYEYNIIIDPKMAFGTGHHQTTKLMIKAILNMDIENKAVLDMGSGTAVLAILCSMRGADPVTAIDIDKWAYDNAVENTQLNNVKNIEVKIGGAELLGAQKFDIILANINRNILLNDIKHYVKVLNPDGELYMSGFYTEDVPVISEECEKYDLKHLDTSVIDNWASVKFKKVNSKEK